MVVIVVKTANLYAEFWCGIVVKAARLVGGAQMFVEHGRDEGILRQRGLNAPKHVFPTVFQEHLRMVFKEMFGIALEVPVFSFPIQLKMPTAELVAFVVEVGTIEGITAARDEACQKLLKPWPILTWELSKVGSSVRRPTFQLRHQTGPTFPSRR